MIRPPGLTCPTCRAPFSGAVARRTVNGYIHRAACESPSTTWLRGLLHDLRDPEITDTELATRYDLTPSRLRAIAAANNIRRNTDDLELTGGTWVNVRGIARWMPENQLKESA